VRAICVSEGISGRRGDDRDVNVHLAILNRLPAAAMRAQHAHAAHVALGAVVAKWAVHAAFDVVNHARLHQVYGGGLRRERCAGKPHQVAHADAGGGLEGHQGNSITVAQVMMAGDDHAVAQATFAQRSFEIRDALVAVLRIVGGGANGRGSFAG
jgi:hypothetical protein